MIFPFSRNQVTGQAIVLNGNNQGIVINGSVKGNIIQSPDGEQHQLTALHIPWDSKPDPDNIAAMLTWKSRIPAKLIGRDRDMEVFLQWAKSEFPLKLRIIHAQGGIGKTRFAFELAETLKQEGWNAGQMIQPDANIAYQLGQQGLLLIIDYPEEQGEAIAILVRQLARIEIPADAKIRILLLSRRDSLPEFPGPLENHYDPAYPLASFNIQQDDAWELFQSATQTMQQYRPADAGKQQVLSKKQFKAWQKSDPLHTRPLFILAFARHLIDQPEQIALQGAEIIKTLVARETRRIREESTSKNMDADAVMLLKALAGVTEGIDQAAFEKFQTITNLEIKLPEFKTLTRSSLWDSNSQSIPALQPDLLAAELLQAEMSRDYLDSGQWLFQALTPDSDDRQNKTLDRLGRLIFDYQYTLKIKQQTPADAETHWLASLVGYIESNEERCKALESIVYHENLTQALLPLSIAVSNTLLENCDDLAQQARILNNLSVDLAETGKRLKGLRAIQYAVKIREQLAEQNFAAYAPDLAKSLSNLSNRLAETDKQSQGQGLEEIQRAVKIHKQLAEQNFAAYAPDLAMSLNNLSIRLDDAGKWSRGLEAIQSAVEIREQLAEQNFAAYAPELASSLAILSNLQAESGDRETAITNMERAIEHILSFAKPGTLYADWHQKMLKQLNTLKSKL